MGSMTFVRDNPVEGSIFNRFSFDSEPRGTIARSIGVYEPSVELVPIPEESKGRFDVYEVRAKQLETSVNSRRQGILHAEKRESLWERMR